MLATIRIFGGGLNVIGTCNCVSSVGFTVSPSPADIMSIRGGCFRNGSIAVTLSGSQCVDEDITYFILNCSESTCIPLTVECPASGNISVTLGSRSGSHEVNVYAVNRCDMIGDFAARTVSAPLGGKNCWVGTLDPCIGLKVIARNNYVQNKNKWRSEPIYS